MDNQASNKEAMKELEENKQTLSAHNKDLAHQLASALKSLSDLEARYKEQQSHLSSSESSSADLELKLRNLSIDYERATRHIASLEKDMASLVSRNEVAEKSHDLAVTAQKLAEEKASMAEAALSSWKQFEVDRKRLMKEREDQLKELAEVTPSQ
jgi:chromosome segregation ATPase